MKYSHSFHSLEAEKGPLSFTFGHTHPGIVGNKLPPTLPGADDIMADWADPQLSHCHYFFYFFKIYLVVFINSPSSALIRWSSTQVLLANRLCSIPIPLAGRHSNTQTNKPLNRDNWGLSKLLGGGGGGGGPKYPYRDIDPY